MKMLSATLRVVLAFVGCGMLIVPSDALDLNGVWATDGSSCDKLFLRKGNEISFNKDSGEYGGGFVVKGSQIIGQLAKCHIKSKKDDGSQIQISATCLTDIMPSDVHFQLKIVDANTITRTFPEMEGMELTYVRCAQ
jgi:hypothetical protein